MSKQGRQREKKNHAQVFDAPIPYQKTRDSVKDAFKNHIDESFLHEDNSKREVGTQSFRRTFYLLGLLGGDTYED